MFSGGCKRISGTWVGMLMELRRKEELNKQVSLGSGIGRPPFSCDGNGADCSGLFISFLLPRSTYSIWAREWCGVFPVVHDPLGTGILKRRHCGQRQVTTRSFVVFCVGAGILHHPYPRRTGFPGQFLFSGYLLSFFRLISYLGAHFCSAHLGAPLFCCCELGGVGSLA